MFLTVTLPNIRWALLYGVLLCNARAMGEFGAVAVVSGKIRGETATMPIMIEMLYNEYLSVAAFAHGRAAGAARARHPRPEVRARMALRRPARRHPDATDAEVEPMQIEIDEIAKEFGATTALHPVSLVDPLGRAGRAARALGLGQDHAPAHPRRARGAELRAGCSSTAQDATGLRVQERRAGFVFQHYALFRHMTVFENIAYGLRARPRAHAADRAPRSTGG